MALNPVTVRINPYELQLWLGNRPVACLTPDEAQALVQQLVAAIRTLARPTPEQAVVH